MNTIQGISHVVDSIERYMTVLILGIFTVIFFHIVVTGTMALSEKTLSLVIRVAIISQ